MEYKSQYLHPRWQKKRLEILNRDHWQCKICGVKDKTLHVHHTYYKKGAKVWEAENKWLKTLCEDCHAEEPILINIMIDKLILMIKQSGITSDALDHVVGEIEKDHFMF